MMNPQYIISCESCRGRHWIAIAIKKRVATTIAPDARFVHAPRALLEEFAGSDLLLCADGGAHTGEPQEQPGGLAGGSC